MDIIDVFDIVGSKAISTDKGMALRNEIEHRLSRTGSLTLNFNEVRQFTTLFFNSSLGYLITSLGPEIYNQCIKLENLSQLGKSTYEQTYRNAINHYALSSDKKEIIKEIINNTDFS